METVRRIEFIKENVLPALAVFLVFVLLFLFRGLSFDRPTQIGFILVYFVIMFLRRPLYYILCQLWNPLSPIKTESILETVFLHLVSHSLIILASLAFLTRGQDIITLQSSMIIIGILFPLSFAWTVMNKYVMIVSKSLKSADFQVWKPQK